VVTIENRLLTQKPRKAAAASAKSKKNKPMTKVLLSQNESVVIVRKDLGLGLY